MKQTWSCSQRACKRLKQVAKEVGLDLRGAYLNLDGGFDSAHNRKCIFNAGLIPNIKENPRNRKRPKRGRKRLFNAAIHALRMRVERTFAWEDKFKRLLLRFERIQQRHYGMKLMAYTLINLRGSAVPKTRNQLRGSCWIPGSWMSRWRSTRLLSSSLPGSPYFSKALKMSCASRTTREHKTPESNKSDGGMLYGLSR